MKQIISAGFIIFRRDPERGIVFLLLYHGRNHWSFPKGWIEPGEQAVAASFREVAEETSIRPHDLRIVPGFKATDRFFIHGAATRHRDSHNREKASRQETAFKIVIYYLAETKKRDVTISHEHQGFGWFAYHEALRVAKYEDIKKLLKQAHDCIEKNLRRHAAHPPRHGRHVR